MRNQTEQIRDFLHALFVRHDIIEIRPFETWTDAGGRKRSRSIRHGRLWCSRDQVIDRFETLERLNQEKRANIFFGVNPRRKAGGGKKLHVRLARSVWTDLDDMSVDDARQRVCSANMPKPSLLVDSGHGVHAYWLLDEPVEFRRHAERAAFERKLKTIYQRLGADSTQDVSRLLRLPGFLNVKNVRNSQEPKRSVLVDCNGRKHSLDAIASGWSDTGEKDAPNRRQVQRLGGIDQGTSRRNAESANRAQAVVRQLEKPVEDRSRRDFAVVCKLVRLGLSDNEVWSLVQQYSKFASNGEQYFRITVANARSATTRQRHFR